MQQPAPQELLEGEAHRPLLRLAPGAFGPLFILEDHLLATAGAQPAIGDRATAQVAGQI